MQSGSLVSTMVQLNLYWFAFDVVNNMQTNNKF
jgi:hypothetical protein